MLNIAERSTRPALYYNEEYIRFKVILHIIQKKGLANKVVSHILNYNSVLLRLGYEETGFGTKIREYNCKKKFQMRIGIFLNLFLNEFFYSINRIYKFI